MNTDRLNEDIQQAAQKFDFTAQTDVTWSNWAGSGARVVQAGYHQINPNVPLQSTTYQFYPSQRTKLYNLFNMYQQYRLVGVTKHWVPLFVGTDQAAYANATHWAQQTETEQEDQFNNAYAHLYLNTSTITYAPDGDDVVVRDNNLDEYVQARAMPGSKTFRINEPHSVFFQPKVVGILQNPEISGTNANVFGPATITNFQTNTQIMGIAPEAMPWIATKVNNKQQGGAVSFNVNVNMYGWKEYIFTPFNTINTTFGGVNVACASIQKIWHFEFRYPDSRAFVALPSFPQALQIELDNSIFDESTKKRSHGMILPDDAKADFRVVNEQEERAKRMKKTEEEQEASILIQT